MASGIKYNFDEVKNEIEKIGFKVLSDEYVNARTNMEIIDDFGYKYYTRFGNLMCGKSPHKFSKFNPFTMENLKTFFKINSLNIVILTKEYTHPKQKVYMICECGENFSRQFTKIVNRMSFKCDKCAEISRRNSHSLDNKIIENAFIENGFFIINKPKELRTEHKMTCVDKKGYKYFATYRQVVGGGVETFSKLNPYTIYNIRHFIKLNNLNLKLITKEYNGNQSHMVFRCMCNEYYTTTWNRLSSLQGIRCQRCSGYQSNIAFLTEEYIKSLNLTYDKEVTFDDINDIKFGKLRFDFMVNNVLIEVDGIQHFEPVEYYGGEKAFKSQRNRDEKKNKYCKNKNIKLVRIPYWDFDDDNYKQILYKELIENNPSKE